MIKNTILYSLAFFSIFFGTSDAAVIAEADDVEPKKISIDTYKDETGTYDVEEIIRWASAQDEIWVEIPADSLFNFFIWDRWSSPETSQRLSLKQFLEDEFHRGRILRADTVNLILLTNRSTIIAGIYWAAKAMHERLERVRCLFVDQSVLARFQIMQVAELESIVPDLPIKDRLLAIDKALLPEDSERRRGVLEDYFPEHLASAEDQVDHWQVRLERPSSPYVGYSLDPQIREGLTWWKPGTRIRDIPIEKRPLQKGLLALEDQWSPLSWSLYFRKNGFVPEELVLLHIDDHLDMMSPRIGLRSDGNFVDFIAGDLFSLLKPETVESAILSGAIGKGSIITPLVWEVRKIHVRHLTFRPEPDIFSLKKVALEDLLLGISFPRISIQHEKVERDSLLSDSNYIPTSDIDIWLSDIPADVPIFLHVDMDFFNNRFDGSSAWQEDGRGHDISIDEQLGLVKDIFRGIERRHLESRIVDLSLCFSPSFFPAEFWEPVSKLIQSECQRLGIM